MGHGMRHDFLEARWNMYNFHKLVELGSTISRRLETAVKGHRKHLQELTDFSASFPENTITEWTKMVTDYHSDPVNNKDPYRTLTPGKTSSFCSNFANFFSEFTITDVEKELRAEEANSRSLASGEDNPITEADFIIMGLGIEHDQWGTLHVHPSSHTEDPPRRKLRLDIAAKRNTEGTDIEKRRTALGRKITSWLAYQGIFMPHVPVFRSANPTLPRESSTSPGHPTISPDDDEEEAEPEETAEDATTFPLNLNAEDVVLYLPSHEASVNGSFAPPSLVNKEFHLRKGRLEVHLKQLRRLLRVKVAVYLDKAANSVGQRAGTRANTMLAEYNRKIENTATHYREERAATLRLNSTGSWRHQLKDLKKADVRPVSMNESDAEDAPNSTRPVAGRSVWRQGKRSISWIWKVPMQRTDSDGDTHPSANAEASQAGEDEPTVPFEASPEEIGDGKSVLLPTGVSWWSALALQVEWAKTYARVNRFAEEEELVIEEMKRVRRYFTWRVKWWKELVSETNESAITRGRAAYAQKQMGLIRKLDSKFAGLWRGTLHGLGMPIDIVDDLE
jgi:hypothetical protein